MTFIVGHHVRIPDGREGYVTATSEGSHGEVLYHVYTEDGATMKSFFAEELREIRPSRVKQPKANFSVGDRVFYTRKIPDKFPLGVVTNIDWILVYASSFYNTGNYRLVIEWDNGVESLHDPIEIGRTEDAIAALSLPIP
jgi:hypothetical protein